jgi:hypothetical protein
LLLTKQINNDTSKWSSTYLLLLPIRFVITVLPFLT